jgi:beta-lactamase superfamily II metal-dependent hydrolase
MYMSKIKSFAVGNGDMYYINHNSDNFTIIDCCLSDQNQKAIVDEIKNECKNKGITRFISTHPDDDHFCGIKYLDDAITIANFYCVKNNAIKSDITDHFRHYCKLRGSENVFHLEKGCSRQWMNESSNERGSSGINVLWPDCNNRHYREALTTAESGGSPNNISPIIRYNLEGGAAFLWMGDLETDFIETIKYEVNWPKVNVLFAPHHGRNTGKIPEDVLQEIDPDIIVIGEAPAVHLNYYQNYNTITQNSAGNITFECEGNNIHISVSTYGYRVNFLAKKYKITDDYYLGTLTVGNL